LEAELVKAQEKKVAFHAVGYLVDENARKVDKSKPAITNKIIPNFVNKSRSFFSTTQKSQKVKKLPVLYKSVNARHASPSPQNLEFKLQKAEEMDRSSLRQKVSLRK